MDYESFHESLKYHLQKKGHGGQALVCRHTGIPKSYLSRIVKMDRRAGLKTQTKIARFFGFGLEEFIEIGRRLTLGEDPEQSADLLKILPEEHLLQRLTEAVRKEIATARMLNRAQLLYEDIVENSMQLIIRFDAKFKISFANRAAELMTGLEWSQLLKLEMKKLVHKGFRAGLMEKINAVYGNGGSFTMEVTNPSGTRWLYITITVFQGDVGGKDKGQLVGFDITEKKKLEDKLRFIQHGVEMSYVPTLWVASDAGIVYVNQALSKLLGYSKEELLTMHVWDINPLIPKKTWRKTWKWFATEEKVVFAGQYKKKDGEIIPVEFQVSNLEYPDNRRYNVVFVKTM